MFDVVPGVCWSHSSSLGATTSSTLITTGTAVAFTLHIFCIFHFDPWYSFSHFLFYHYCCLLLGTNSPGYFISLDLEITQDISPSILLEVSPILTLGLPNPNLVQMFLYIIPKTWLWSCHYVLDCLGGSLHILVLGSSLEWSLLLLCSRPAFVLL